MNRPQCRRLRLAVVQPAPALHLKGVPELIPAFRFARTCATETRQQVEQEQVDRKQVGQKQLDRQQVDQKQLDQEQVDRAPAPSAVWEPAVWESAGSGSKVPDRLLQTATRVSGSPVVRTKNLITH
ncbi:unannotated protein [freshwater metagenome]|uniref:Unannotated protein n=1 Tax=freshwater metagenome TaxID=449393 RepID=A0A6J6R3Q3_9ZZZZ